ncbi:hypothetical protein CEE36_07360 [candidate division TA06 bacterium B3_TA06]|uniref:NodB homology domain-containing protein n=1 Tax=candidate division TA06 bacterium B3_TA06 TaxID=2012487 RepID=A0A532V4A2_UNCT6|nr:MAG: hypothetical protein CEE36_07360 [candidate division TA06 bacterium B3_TA06]
MDARLLILTYHGIHEAYNPLQDDSIYSIPHNDFTLQLDYISGMNCQLSILSAAVDRTRCNHLVLTFDDGLSSAGESVWPELQKRGMRATFFIPPGCIGKASYIDWPTVRRMASQGAEFGTHGYYHLPFAALDDRLLRQEIVRSKLELEDKLGTEVRVLAAPGGSLHPRAAAIARQAGYLHFCTSRRILNPLPAHFMLGRFPLKRKTPEWLFRSTARINSSATALHRVIDLSKSSSKRLFPGLFSGLRKLVQG